MHTRTMLASIIALTLSGGVWAAETSEQSKDHKESASSTMTESQKATSEGEKGLSEKASTAQTPVESYRIRASKLMDKEVRNPQDEEIGNVDDLIVTEDGQVRVIISVGGFLGLGERLVAVPYDELQPGPEGEEYLTYSASREELEQEPEFKYDQDESGWGMKKEGQEKEEMKEGVQEEKKQ